jgi:hypothetical protein
MSELAENAPKKEGFFKSLWKGFFSSFKRFPVEALICITYFVQYAFFSQSMIEAMSRENTQRLSILFIPILLVSFCLHRFAMRSTRYKTIWYELYAASYLLVWATLLIPKSYFNWWGMPTLWVFMCNIIAIAFLFAGDRIMENKPYSVFTSNTAVKLAFTSIICLLVLGLLELIILSLDMLLLNSHSDKLYLIPAQAIRYIVTPMLCLHFISEEETELKVKRFIGTCVNYIFTPALIIYTVILYIYIVKILFNWELPQGGVAYMVSIFCTLALICMLIRQALEKTTFNWFYKYFPAIAIPPVILLWTGICRRVSEYGVTTERAYLIIITILITAFIAMIAFRKTRRFQIMTIVLGVVLAVFTLIPGITAKDFGIRSQMARLDKMLPEILVDNQFPSSINYEELEKDKAFAENYIKAKDTYDYLKENMDNKDFNEKYGDYGVFKFDKWQIHLNNVLAEMSDLPDRSNKTYHSSKAWIRNYQETDIGEYTVNVPDIKYIFSEVNGEHIFINYNSSRDTLLRCNIKERWESLDDKQNLTPEKERYMTIYQNDKYLGIIRYIDIDSASIRAYEQFLFRKP